MEDNKLINPADNAGWQNLNGDSWEDKGNQENINNQDGSNKDGQDWGEDKSKRDFVHRQEMQKWKDRAEKLEKEMQDKLLNEMKEKNDFEGLYKEQLKRNLDYFKVNKMLELGIDKSLWDLISGQTEAEIESSIAKVKAYVDSTKSTLEEQIKKQFTAKSPATNWNINLGNQVNTDLNEEQIRNLSSEDFEKYFKALQSKK